MASYCKKCSQVWDGSVAFISCESCASTFDIDCVKITKTMFNAFSNGKNWSWKCDSCRFSSYRIMSNNLKELTNTVDLLRNELLFLKNLLAPDKFQSDKMNGSQSTLSVPPCKNQAKTIHSSSVLPPAKSQSKSTIETRSRSQALKNQPTKDDVVTIDQQYCTDNVVTLEAASHTEKKWFYVSNFKPGTTETMVKSFIISKSNFNAADVIVKSLLRRDHDPTQITFASFKVGFDVIADTTNIENIWPVDISFAEFIPKNLNNRRHRC